jgi:hypothetical protein
MEVGAQYDRAVTKQVGISVYAAPAGEPALGPVAFMHRLSAMDNLAAPLGHHWQDATHVSFGVLTGGIFTRRVAFAYKNHRLGLRVGRCRRRIFDIRRPVYRGIDSHGGFQFSGQSRREKSKRNGKFSNAVS